MKRLVVALTLAAALLLPAGAAAKELASVQICGPDGCKNISGPGNLGHFPMGDEPSGTIPPPAAFYEVRFTSKADGRTFTWTTWYVPSAGALAVRDDRTGIAWSATDADAMAKAAAGVKPFPKPEVTAVRVGSKRVTSDPKSYLALYSVRSAGDAVPSGLADWEPIVFQARHSSPWTMSDSGLYFSATNGMVQRGIEIVKLPDDMAASVRAGESLADGSSFPWRTLVFVTLGGAALVAAAAAFRPVRRRMSVGRQPTPA